MNIVLGTITLIVGIVEIVLIYLIVKSNSLKEKEGRVIFGRKIGCDELPGRPTRYIVKVEYEIESMLYTKTIVTADKNIKKCANNEQIELIYVDKTNKIYWADDKSPERMLSIGFLVFSCGLLFQFSVASFIGSISPDNQPNGNVSEYDYRNRSIKEEYTAMLSDNKEDFNYVAEMVEQCSSKSSSGYLTFYIKTFGENGEIEINDRFTTNDRELADAILNNEEFYDHLMNLYNLEKISQILCRRTTGGYIIEFQLKDYQGSLCYVENREISEESIPLDEKWEAWP